MNAQAKTVSKDTLKGISIPPKPQILIDIQAAGEDTTKIAQLISQDTSVSAAVLKTINSPYFALTSKITSIQKAVMLLGAKSVVSVVNALMLRSSLSKDLSINMSEFWDSSMDTAKAASAIASDLRSAKPDVAYTVGLFHNCGIPILMQKYKDYTKVMEQSYAHPQGLVQQVEQQALGVDHCLVGSFLCKHWNLDEMVSEAVLHHHSGPEFFTACSNPQLRELVATLMLAEHFVGIHRIIGHVEQDHTWLRVKDAVCKQLELKTEDDYNDIHNFVLEKAFDKRTD